MAHFSGISVLFPMWNEEAGMRHAVAAAREACEELVREGEVSQWEIVLVDDASTDRTGTKRMLREMAAQSGGIRRLRPLSPAHLELPEPGEVSGAARPREVAAAGASLGSRV